jgi:hypothetical protein
LLGLPYPIAEVRESVAHGTADEAQREDRIWFNREPAGLINRLPEELAAHLDGPDLRHVHLVAGNCHPGTTPPARRCRRMFCMPSLS